LTTLYLAGAKKHRHITYNINAQVNNNLRTVIK
jgi:hypothetical protein